MPAIRDWLTGSFAGRALLVGTFIESATLAFAALTGPLSALPAAIDAIGGLILLAGVSMLVYRLFVIAKRRMLWRGRRKLTLSCIFIGLVGITEAMNGEGDWFGDARLSTLLEDQADLPFEELRERIFREIAACVGGAAQQDDMAMLLLKGDH